MRSSMVISCMVMVLTVAVLILFIPYNPAAGDISQSKGCIDKAVEKVLVIRSLPEKHFLLTLDHQNVPLDEFQYKCLQLYPKCFFYDKFYYLPNETREIVSKTETGLKAHKVRCYNNYLSLFCPKHKDAKKIYGDVAEFYDENGKFMGLCMYMGEGMYFPLKYSGYRK